MPNVELPGGDWTMTVNFSGEFQTAREELGIGVMDTETSYLRSAGQQYIVCVTLGADAKEWTTVERITAINAKGKPILYLRQYEKVTGETLVNIDSFKIESDE